MPDRRISPQTSLDSLKKEAKRWLRQLRDGAAEARRRFEAAHPHPPSSPTLRDVQLALARELGFTGWVTLRDAVESRPPVGAPVDEQTIARFLDFACPDHHVRGRRAHRMARHAAMRLVREHPRLATANLLTAIVCGEIDAVRRMLDAQPQLARQKSGIAAATRSGAGGVDDLFRNVGPKAWEPILFLAFTRIDLVKSAENAVAIAKLLLGCGADPNAFFMAGDSVYTPLTGVAGEGEEDRPPHPRRDELARLLMENGANPYDIQVVYDLGFQGKVLWYLQLAYETSVRTGRQADWDDPEWRMLDMGGYGSGARWHLGMAVTNDDRELAAWCLAHGASPTAAPPSDPRFPQRSLYEEAVIRGHHEIAELLVRHGADPVAVAVTPEDAFAAAALKLDRERAGELLTLHPELRHSTRALFEAVRRDRADVVAFLLDLGVPLELENPTKNRALHVAASHDAVAVAHLLLERGAEIDPVETKWGNTPLDFAVYHEHPRMIALLVPRSRDVWNLAFVGEVDRIREVLGENPDLAKVTWQTTPLFWLPEDEQKAIEIVRLFTAHGADPAFRSKKDGSTAADVARKRGMTEVAAVLDSFCGAKSEGSEPREPAQDVPYFESLADDLVRAYDAPDDGALERLSRHFRRKVTHEDVQAGAWRRVYALRQRSSSADEVHLLRSEAQELIARDAGFGDWAAFVESVTRGTPPPAAPFQIDRKRSRLRARHALQAEGWDAAIERIAALGLEEVDANDQMTDEILSRIAELPHVKRLRLGGSRALTDEGLAHLARMPQLEELDLSEYPGGILTDRGLEVLRHLPNLRRFEMCWQSAITDAGASSLSHCERLESVNLMGTHTGDAVLSALAGKPELRRLKVGRRVTDAGLRLLHQFPRFAQWSGGDTSLQLMSPDPGPTHLLLDGPITDDGVKQLDGLDGIFGLGFFRHARLLTTAALRSLARLANLGMLAWEGERCDDEAMRAIAALPYLRMLLAQGAVASDAGFEALAQSKNLEILWGRECANLTGRGFRALARMRALRALGVSLANVDDDALALLSHFPSLVELMPMDVQDSGFRHVGGCRNLESLWCMYCRETGDAATEHIRPLRLKTYYAGLTKITDRSLEVLSAMESLERVQLHETRAITEEGVARLARLPSLKELSLEGIPRVSPRVVSHFRPTVDVNVSL